MAAKRKIVIIIIAIVFLVIAAISCQWYKQNVYPYKYVEECYTQNQEHFADITAYFKSFNTADIKLPQ